MPRVPYVDSENLPSDYKILDDKSECLHDSVNAEYWNSAATVQAFANNPELSKMHVFTNTTLWAETGLSLPEVELVILVVARELNSLFIWHGHAIKSIKQADISPQAVLAISNKNFEYFEGKKYRLAKYVYEFVRRSGKVDWSTHTKLAAKYDDSTVVGITMLAGFYIHLHHVATALKIDHNEEFVGWDLENVPSQHDRY